MTTTLTALQQQRRDTASNWTSNNTVLLAGEWGIETDTKKFKIGDGTTAWQSLDYVPIPDANRLLTGDLTIAGSLTVNGTTTEISTQNLNVEDKNIILGKVSSPSDTTADGGGLTLQGLSNKTFNWVDATDSWTSSEHLNLLTGKVFKIAGTEILNATGLGSTVVSSSLTSLGTIATGVWQGTPIGSAYMVAGTLSVAGALQLTDSVTSTSTTTAATPNSVKTAKDAADSAQTTANAALPKSGGQITGNITCSGSQTFDGRDLSVDGAKLDGIQAGATGNQTKADIDALGVNAATFTVADESTDTSCSVLFSTGASGEQAAKSGSNFTFNSATGDVSATKFTGDLTGDVTGDVTGDLTGDVTGNVSGSSGSCTGNSATATALANARTISGASFDGTSDITLNNSNITNGAGYITATLTNEQVQDIIGAMLAGNTETGITVTYDDTDGTIDFVVATQSDNNLTNALLAILNGLSSSAGVLSNGVTATTQSASDNSTKVATTAYTDTAISNLVDSSPSTLNTLNELAAALGDDANFSTTVTNSIATKLALAGGTLTGNLTLSSSYIDFSGSISTPSTSAAIYRPAHNQLAISTANTERFRVTTDKVMISVDLKPDADSVRDLGTNSNRFANGYFDTLYGDGSNLTGISASSPLVNDSSPQLGGDLQSNGNDIDFADNDKAIFGTGGDLEIYHDGSHSYLKNTFGNLFLQNDNGFILEKVDGTNMIKATGDNSVELYYSGAKKVETTSGGFKVHNKLELPDGGATGTSARIVLGNSDDLKIYHDGTNSYINDTGTGYLILVTSNLRINNSANNEAMIHANENGAVELYHDNSKKFDTVSGGARIFGYLSMQGSGGHVYLPDTAQVKLGNSEDLQIYHDGDNYINLPYDQELRITHGSDYLARFLAEGAVILYHDHSKKFETTSTGAKVTGTLETTSGINAGNHISLNDNVEVKFGNSDDFKIYHSGSHSYLDDSSGTGNLFVLSNQFEVLNTASSEYMLRCIQDAGVQLYYNGSKKLETTTNGIKLNDNTRIGLGDGEDLQLVHTGSQNKIIAANAELMFQCNNFNFRNENGSENFITATENASVSLYYDNSKKLETGVSGDYGSYSAENGKNGWDGISVAGAKFVFMGSGSSDQVGIYNDSENEWMLRCTRNAQTDIRYDGSVKLTSSSTGVSVTGALTASGNVTAFSDINLKKDVSTINDALGTVGKLRGVSYKWKENNQASIGVIAQEVEEIIPEVVHTSEHNGKEVKSVDYGKMVGVLIEAIKELKAEIEELKRAK